MIKKALFLGCLLLLLMQQGFAQRPLPQVGGAGTNGARQGRQLAQPQEQDAEGRRTLLDDSTKQVYGPKTTLYFYEKAIKRNSLKLFELDTLLNNFHNYDPVAKSGWKYQDLGNIGTAARPVFYTVPMQIGLTSGLDGYDIYFRDPSERRFYDTKSPFTEMAAFFGGGNRNMLDVSFARNVNPRWNIGFDFHTLRIRKTLNPAQRDDHMTVQNAYELHTNYRSENGRYWLLGAFSRSKHLVNEIGGIIPTEVDPSSLYFTYEDAKVWLQKARATDLRQQYHLYHEYKLGNGLQFYHVFDRKNHDLVFETPLNGADAAFFNKNRFINPDTTRNINDFAEWKNEIGMKGTFKGFYYNSYLKLRNGRMESPYLSPERQPFNEVFIGGELIGKISEKWEISADGEYLIPGNFKIHGVFISPWLDVEYTKALYKPTSIQQTFIGNHYKWENNFSNIGVDQIRGTAKATLKNIRLRPALTLNRINNYVYFGLDRKAAQANGGAFMIMPSLEGGINIGKKFRLETELIYTQVTGEAANVFRIPKWFNNTKFYFDSPLFDENVFVQMGVDFRFKSSYFADAYDPALQQFHLQNSFSIYAYPIFDLFLDFRINRTRVLFKYNHLNAGLMSREGYFVTPDYTGYRSFLDLGISWYLFD